MRTTRRLATAVAITTALIITPAVATAAASSNGLIAYAHYLFENGEDCPGCETGSVIDVVKPDGTGHRTLLQTTEPSVSFHNPRWSPDGTKIAYLRQDHGSHAIWVAAADGSNARRLAAADEGTTPAWSPDSTRIAYAKYRWGEGTDIWVVGATGNSKPLRLTKGVGIDHQPAWSPDSKQLAFTYVADTDNDYKTPDTSNIHVLRRTDKATPSVRLTNTRDDDQPAWSPRGNRVVFHSQDLPDGELHTVYATGGQEKTIAYGSYQHALSPTGTRVAYAGPSGLRVIDVDGKNGLTVATDSLYFNALTWSPDSTALAFLTGDLLRIATVDGTSDMDLLTHPALHGIDW